MLAWFCTLVDLKMQHEILGKIETPEAVALLDCFDAKLADLELMWAISC